MVLKLVNNFAGMIVFLTFNLVLLFLIFSQHFSAVSHGIVSISKTAVFPSVASLLLGVRETFILIL